MTISEFVAVSQNCNSSDRPAAKQFLIIWILFDHQMTLAKWNIGTPALQKLVKLWTCINFLELSYKHIKFTCLFDESNYMHCLHIMAFLWWGSLVQIFWHDMMDTAADVTMINCIPRVCYLIHITLFNIYVRTALIICIVHSMICQ